MLSKFILLFQQFNIWISFFFIFFFFIIRINFDGIEEVKERLFFNLFCFCYFFSCFFVFVFLFNNFNSHVLSFFPFNNISETFLDFITIKFELFSDYCVIEVIVWFKMEFNCKFSLIFCFASFDSF